jgi:hypothetical protein
MDIGMALLEDSAELLDSMLLEDTGYVTEMPYVHSRQSPVLLELSLGGWAPLFMG